MLFFVCGKISLNREILIELGGIYMKRILAMVLSVAIVAAVAIGGTVAYLTDTDSATNVFTVGNVEIKLLEHQRKSTASTADGNFTVTKSTDLEDFQDKNMMPIIPDLDADGKETLLLDDLGMNKAQNYQDKIIRVQNTGSSDAWVRIFVAIPAALENTETDTRTVLHWDKGERFDVNTKGAYNTDAAASPYTTEFGAPTNAGSISVGDVEYNVYCFTRRQPLKANETTAAAVVGLYLDEMVDNNSDDGYYYLGSKTNPANRITTHGLGAKKEDGSYYPAYDFEQNVLIPVCAEAVQTTGFESADQAFTRAINGNYDPYNPWRAGNAGITVEGAVKTVADFKAALDGLPTATEDWKIVLNPYQTYDFSGVTFSNAKITKAKSITIEGNNAVITGLSQPLIGYSSEPTSVTINNLTICNVVMTNTEEKTSDEAVQLRAQSYGAFIQAVSGKTESVTLFNCHLENSKITSAQSDNSAYNGEIFGGLIGICQLKDNGKLTVSNCSVEGSTITGKSVVGGIIGNLRTNSNKHSYAEITNTTVKNCTIESTHKTRWGVGTIVGSNNDSTITATGFTEINNTLVQTGVTAPASSEYRDTYGVKGTNAHLTVNGTEVLK